VTRILGIDPGSRRTGVGVIDVDGAGRARHVYSAALELTPAADFPQRLKRLLLGLAGVLDEYRPDEAAVEQVFMARNPDSALKLGQARGAAVSAVVLRDIPVHEYAAREVKLAMVGSGRADKQQIQHMMTVMLNLDAPPQADAADALAVALTHAHLRASAARLGVPVRQNRRR